MSFSDSLTATIFPHLKYDVSYSSPLKTLDLFISHHAYRCIICKACWILQASILSTDRAGHCIKACFSIMMGDGSYGWMSTNKRNDGSESNRGPRPDETLRIHDCEGRLSFFFPSSVWIRRLNGGVDAGSLVPDGTEFHRVHR